MTLSFHRADATHVHTIAMIGQESYLHHFKDIWHYPDELESYVQQEYHPDHILQSLNEPNTQWWMIRQIQDIGFIKLSFDQIIPLEHQTSTLIQPLSRGVCINKIYLRPQYTGQGLGYLIFQFIEQQLFQQQNSCFWLEVLQDNHAAKKFYLQQGMQIIADDQYQYSHQQHQLNIMYKELNSISK